MVRPIPAIYYVFILASLRGGGGKTLPCSIGRTAVLTRPLDLSVANRLAAAHVWLWPGFEESLSCFTMVRFICRYSYDARRACLSSCFLSLAFHAMKTFVSGLFFNRSAHPRKV